MGHALASRTVLAARHPATIVAVVCAVAFGVAVLVHPGTWATFTALAAGDRETLRDMLLGFGVLAPLASILLNIMQAVVAPLPGFVVPFVNGAVFGTWWGMLITWIGGTAAAATCFWISRTFGRRFAERMCSRSTLAESLNEKLERHSFAPIVVARLIPGVPFDFFSYFVGLTRVRFTPFIVATMVGSAPHAFVYAYMGSSLQMPLWLGVLMTPLLGLIYAGVKWSVRAVRRVRRGAALPPAQPVAAASPLPVASPVPTLATWVAPAFIRCQARRPVDAAAWASSGAAPSVRPAAR